MTNEPSIVDRAEQAYAGITRTVRMSTMSQIADRIPLVLDHLGRAGIVPAGPPFLRYFVIDMDNELVVQAGVPVDADDVARIGNRAGDDTVCAGTLPAGRYAEVLYRGHFDGLVEATSALLNWAADQGLAWDMQPSDAGDVWGCRLERFLTDPMEQPDPNQWETTLTFRLARD
jgi:effector-binding domain-containing protein